MVNNQDVVQIDYIRLIGEILKKWWFIVLCAVGGAVAALLITLYCITPMYSSEILMYVNNSTISLGNQLDSITSGDISTSRTLVSTYAVILKARTTLEEIAARAGVDYTALELDGMITASSVNSTEVFRVEVTCSDPNEACLIANTVANVLPDKISTILDGTSARIVDMAVADPTPVSPSYTKNTAIGILIGVVASAAILVASHLLNDKIEEEDMISQLFGEDIPLLAVLPENGASRRGKYKGYYYNAYNNKYAHYGYYRSTGTSDKKAQ